MSASKAPHLRVLFFLLTIITWNSSLADSAVGIDAKISTLGAGFDITLPLSDRFNARLGIHRFDASYSLNEAGIDYDADLELDSAGLFLDWHPFKGTFRVTVGYLANDNAIKGRATGNLTVGNNGYAGVDLRGTISFESGTYLGIGWGNTGTRGWALIADIGLLHQGSPDVTLRDETGTVSSADLDAEAAELENELEDFDLYPVLGIGISYSF
ncbi:MAG: hypothetical protein Kow006_13150 [Gammaproteobacteria bacterium]